jgi:hypothetical protein
MCVCVCVCMLLVFHVAYNINSDIGMFPLFILGRLL